MKSKIKQLIYFAICLPAVLLLIAWPGNKAEAQKAAKPLNPKLQAIAKGGSTPDWVDFREGTAVNPTTVFTDLKDAFELSERDNMKSVKNEKDDIGFTHYRYQQYYKNLPVVYGEFIVHQNAEGFTQSANGRLIKGLKLGNTPSLSENQALSAALGYMNAKKYLWQSPAMENELKRTEKNEQATYYPKGELVYAPGDVDGSFNAAEYKLAWQFKIYTDDPAVTAKSVYIDALTGKVIHHNDIAMNCSGGSGTSAFNGSVGVSTQLSGGSYRSLNDCQTTQIRVYNCAGGGATTNYYTDADNSWTDQSAVQAQYGAAGTYAYYNGQHGRLSWNNANGDLIALNNAFAGSNNACWGCQGNNAIFYAGNTSAATDDWNTDDIMGHEFTHGVTQASAGLTYSKESGGLNESYSDIFGEMVESWLEGNCDYLVGGDRGAIRSFITPKSYGQPDTYLGTNWYTTTGCTPGNTNDNCGVHTNSGVQNKWFYLLSEGGSGTNDFGTTYNITGITRFKARLIAYRALTMYETSSSAYIDARAATLHAAYDLYGQCSAEIIAVGDAWHAVGVESQSAQFIKSACGTFSSGEFVQAISQLNSGGSGCTTVANSATNIVYFTARDRVVLSPGFTATEGSKFVAYLEPCSSTMWKQGNNNGGVIMSDPEKGIKNVVPIVSAKEAVKSSVSAESISINPNPFTTNFEVSINSKSDVKAQVTIYSSLGVKVSEKAGINVSKGFNKMTFDGSNYSRDVYMVEINMNGEKTVKKIVKM